MHIQSILWFALACAAAGALYRRFMTPAWVAGLAALLYALDDARGIGVGWLSGRNALLTILCGFFVLLCHDRWRRDGWRVGPFLSVRALAMGLLSGEAALWAYTSSLTLFWSMKRRYFGGSAR